MAVKLALQRLQEQIAMQVFKNLTNLSQDDITAKVTSDNAKKLTEKIAQNAKSEMKGE